MSYLATRVVGAGSLTKVYTSADFAVGEKVADEAGNEYVFGMGVASCVAGSWVALDEASQASLLGATSKGRVGVAMGAIVASSYGFFQVYGKTTTALAAVGFVDDADIYATATAGTVDDAVVVGDRVKGAIGRSAVSGGVITAELNFPLIDQIAD